MSPRTVRRVLAVTTVCIVIASAIATAVFFPWDTDPQDDVSAQTRSFYTRAYDSGQGPAARSPSSGIAHLSQREQFYVDVARQAACSAGVRGKVAAFVKRFDLQSKKVLEVGAGSGMLQDLVADYTGLDISPTAKRFFHKPFVEASATSIPFPDNSFDALWSVWVLEHIPNPERALKEIRRVVKPGGMILLYPTFSCSRYAAQGYAVRPYSDFDCKGKLTKAVGRVVESWLFRRLYAQQIKLLRSFGARLGSGPSALHFVRLTPNYEQYWVADGDATTSVSFHELYLWFTTRGDRCVSCPSEARIIAGGFSADYLIIQIHK